MIPKISFDGTECYRAYTEKRSGWDLNISFLSVAVEIQVQAN
jgi:hypothetical protein